MLLTSAGQHFKGWFQDVSRFQSMDDDSLQVAYGPYGTYGIVSYSGHLGTLVNPTV